MTSINQINSPAVVLDASLVIGLCAKESNKYAAAKAQLETYAQDGWELFAPGVLIGEVLYVLCKKRIEGLLDVSGYASAIASFTALARAIKPPPNGDLSLIDRAEAIRGAYGCSKTADAVYLALAEELKASRQAEFVTFDYKIKNQAKANSLDGLLKILPMSKP